MVSIDFKNYDSLLLRCLNKNDIPREFLVTKYQNNGFSQNISLMNKKHNRYTIEIIQEEIERYENQLENIQNDESYKNNEEKREQTIIFYTEKIEEYKKMLQ